MKIGEVKLRLSNSVMNMIDTYFCANTLNEKFINSTLKILLKQNIYKIDGILGLFSDQNGDINVEEIVKEYSNMFDENGLIFDLKDYIDNEMIKSFIPNKVLVVKKEDILNIFK